MKTQIYSKYEGSIKLISRNPTTQVITSNDTNNRTYSASYHKNILQILITHRISNCQRHIKKNYRKQQKQQHKISALAALVGNAIIIYVVIA